MKPRALILLFLICSPSESACINCGGADKTSAKRLKMPNKSVFTRLAGIELMEVFEITNQINHEVCAQQCDAHAECAVFEFNLPNKLCVLASEYARLADDLTKGAFETIVFVKVLGKFTKALPKDKETCLDKSEYEDYVKQEVDKWLKPSPKKTSIGSTAASPTTVAEAAQTSTSTTTTSGTTSGGTTTGTSSSTSKGSGGETDTGVGSDEDSSETTTPSGTTPTTTLDAGTTSTSTTTASTPPAAVPPTSVATSSSSSTTHSDSFTQTTVSQKIDGQAEGSSEGSTQSTSDLSSTVAEPSLSTTEADVPFSSESTPSPVEPSSTATTEMETSYGSTSGIDGQGSQWRIKSVHGTYLKVSGGEVKRVEVDSSWDEDSRWLIGHTGDKIYIKNLDSALFLSANRMGNIKLIADATQETLFTQHKVNDESVAFRTTYDTWLTVTKEGKVAHSTTDSPWKTLTLERL